MCCLVDALHAVSGVTGLWGFVCQQPLCRQIFSAGNVAAGSGQSECKMDGVSMILCVGVAMPNFLGLEERILMEFDS